jgi:hypothetical protein
MSTSSLFVSVSEGVGGGVKFKCAMSKEHLVRVSMRVRGPQKRHFEWDKFQMGVNAVRVTRAEIESHQATADNAERIKKMKKRLGCGQVGA